MKFVIAIDSMKGSMTSADAAQAVARGIRQVMPGAECVCVPIADGGEGTLDALTVPGDRVSLTVRGTDGRPVLAQYGIVRAGTGDGDRRAAIIEMASAAGLTLVPEGERDVMTASTYGVGQMILDAARRGCRDILLTVGGSGTNDGGTGLFSAIGGVLYDRDGNRLPGCGASLERIAGFDATGIDPAVRACRFTAACDVVNPLLGASGATAVFGPQKGVTPDIFPRLEAGMARWADLLDRASGVNVAQIPGCGAGGGVLAPLMALFDLRVKSGIDAVLERADFDRLLGGADLCITGEGRIDGQSLCGKAVGGVAKRCRAAGVPLEAVAGCLGEGWRDTARMGIRRISVLTDAVPETVSAEDRVNYSMKHAAKLLEQAGRQIADGYTGA